MDRIKIAMDNISKGTSEIIGIEYIESLVARFYKTGTRFIVKAGFDPTAPDLHLGHSVLLRKLATLQLYGGKIKFLIGDFTATIGDPSGKNETRKLLTFDEVKRNAKTYENQVFKILDRNLTDVVFNRDWLGKLSSSELLILCSKYSVARMMERDDFSKRFKENASISIVEFMYPLLQGYDSVELNCDIELGGNDQKFNLLIGRSLQRAYECGKEQSIITTPLLEGLDGVNKMSKSLNNYIGLDASADSMYAKILSISDELMWKYYELISSKTLQEVMELKNNVTNGNLHPKVAKENLALEITSCYHGDILSKQAKQNFDKIFKDKSIPDNIEDFEYYLPIENSKDSIWICEALKVSGISSSTSEAKRLIKSGALKIDNIKIEDENLKLESNTNYIIKLGKRKIIRFRFCKDGNSGNIIS